MDRPTDLLAESAAALAASDDLDATVARLLEIAAGLAPSYGNTVYNQACVHARLGDLVRAKDELLLALSMERLRFAKLAVEDPDLAPLRQSPELWNEIRPSLGSRAED